MRVCGWSWSTSHMDFAGILNANALYSFTIGVPQLGFALYFLLAKNQESLVVFSTVMSGLSILLSLANICCNFPKHLRKIAEKKAEQARDHLDAMRSTQTTVTRLQEEAFNEKKHRFELAQNDDEGYKCALPPHPSTNQYQYRTGSGSGTGTVPAKAVLCHCEICMFMVAGTTLRRACWMTS